MKERSMFASKTVAEHLGRGVVGIGALGSALALASTHPWVALGLAPLALFALRGCPTCWTIGLVETIAAKMQGKRTPNVCGDGRCADQKRTHTTGTSAV